MNYEYVFFSGSFISSLTSSPLIHHPQNSFGCHFLICCLPYIAPQFCKSSVEPMGEESDHVHIIALSDALGVPIRVVYLDRSTGAGDVTVNHHDFVPSAGCLPSASGGSSETTKPIVTLLYRPGHYDILYPKWSSPVLVKLLSLPFFFGFRVMEFLFDKCMFTCNWKCPDSWTCIGILWGEGFSFFIPAMFFTQSVEMLLSCASEDRWWHVKFFFLLLNGGWYNSQRVFTWSSFIWMNFYC